MPERLAAACAVFGCPNLEPCPAHHPRAPGRRLTSHRLGYDHVWRRFREHFFIELWRLRVPRAGLCGCRHPSAPATDDSICARRGRYSPAELVDHIVPISGPADPRRLDLSNLQGLCQRCHNKKRQRESMELRRT
jgi:5-methylcytosine-specific restriction endonuclease McrA